MTFDIEDGDMYITFSSGYYGDDGGESGKDAYFYKLNENSGEYELYTTITQQNNTQDYSKTYFEEGSYKLTFSSNYVEFDEWTITAD